MSNLDVSNTVVLVACKDLMFRSKVETTLRHMGLAALNLRAVDDPAAIFQSGPVSAAIVDLGLGEQRWQAVVSAAHATVPSVPVLAFGAHVDRAAQAAARSAGCDMVVANSRLARELPTLVEHLLVSQSG